MKHVNFSAHGGQHGDDALHASQSASSFSTALNRPYARAGKRIFDLALSLLLAPAVMAVVAVLWLLTRRDGGPGFYGQARVGRNGEIFKCRKIRTMRVDADQVLAKLLKEDPQMAAEWRLNHKLENDPRITRLGNFLRKTSLDELPQLWNVALGQMSLVGPRPVTFEELEKYGVHAQTYMRVLPGVTGLWQVSGRSRVSYEQRVRMDVRYVRRMSFSSDLNILGLTAREVFVGRGQ